MAIPSLNVEPQSATFGRGSPYFDPEASLRSPQLAPAVPGGWGHASSCVEVCLLYLVPACSPSRLAPPCAAARPCRPDCAAARPARRAPRRTSTSRGRRPPAPRRGRAPRRARGGAGGSRGKYWVILVPLQLTEIGWLVLTCETPRAESGSTQHIFWCLHTHAPRPHWPIFQR